MKRFSVYFVLAGLASVGCSPTSVDTGVPPDPVAIVNSGDSTAAAPGEESVSNDVQPAADDVQPATDEDATDEFALTPQNTQIQFVGVHAGDKPDPRTGTFGEFAGEAQLGEGKLKEIHIEIQTASLNTEIEKLTNHLKSPDFFDVRQHPKAVFRSTSIEPGDDGTVNITGDLTLLGETRTITFPATVSTGDGLSLTATFDLDRTQFGMNYGVEQVEKQVAMTVTVGK